MTATFDAVITADVASSRYYRAGTSIQMDRAREPGDADEASWGERWIIATSCCARAGEGTGTGFTGRVNGFGLGLPARRKVNDQAIPRRPRRLFAFPGFQVRSLCACTYTQSPE